MEPFGDVDVRNPLTGNNVQDDANKLMERVSEYTREIDQRTRAFVREYPTAAVLGAVAVGFLVGRVMVRR
jgi:ElaB/YqjD/DUF883 family membrane-anchored ribosome-binding protein